MAESNANGRLVRRDEALDVARGLAVLGMVWVHFVPGPSDRAEGLLPLIHWASVAALDGLPAALFLILMGASWSVSEGRICAYVIRRAVALSILGLAFWHWVWPNDILVPIAVMMPLLAIVHGMGRRAVVVATLLLLACVPPATALWGDYAWTDVRGDGTHEANHHVGWFTVRYFLINGAYPLLPWMALPLVGALLAPMRTNAAALTRVMLVAVGCATIALVVDQFWGDAYAGGIYAHFDVTWQPTSLPFVALWGGAATFVIAALWRWSLASALPAALQPIAAVGRVSLSHYLLHTVLVYGAMRASWPAEDWPLRFGLAAAVGYALFALLVTPRLLASGRRGPVETMLALCAGRRVR
ncbi:MAG: hypothetical protein ACI8UD_003022 [Planctomycetota bacterium]|jgi:uncharacterized protein